MKIRIIKMDYTNEYLSEKVNGSTLSPTSKKNYEGRMRLLLKMCGEDKMIDVIRNVEGTSSIIKGESSIYNRCMYYSIMLSFIKYGEIDGGGGNLSKRWLDEAQETYDEAENLKKEPTRLQTDIVKVLDWEGVISKLEKLNKSWDEYVLLKTLVVFIENGIDIDYSSLNIVRGNSNMDSKGDNYIYLDADIPYIHVGKSKTIRHTGEYDKVLPPDYVDYLKCLGRESVFKHQTRNRHVAVRNSLLKDIFNHEGMNLNLLRYVYKVSQHGKDIS